MTTGTLHREVEVKVAIQEAATLLNRLRDAGFTQVRPRHFEQNTMLDLPGGTLRGKGELIRLRQADGQTIFTFKGPAAVSRHKEREELEVSVGDHAVMLAILERLGYLPTFRYEKYRTEFARAGEPGVVMLDETPIGAFVEFEGPPDWIDETARSLGYSENDYTNLSYARLYLRYCERSGIAPAHMLFGSDAVRI
ncbi:MAG: class IV adenylate cyclase [Acidobacteria bacterium]|nr:class IV adenylate cyclase [Acidobacteriota bacterium]